MANIGEKWRKVGKVGKSGKKLVNVGKSGEKVVKKVCKVGKSDEK